MVRSANTRAMKNRRSFLSAVAGGGLGLSVAAASAAAPAAAPSSGALATATAFRAFDAELSAAEIRAIAQGIDDNRAAAQVLNPKGKRLRDADEPITRFAADVTIAH